MRRRSRIILGLNSGTSADGVDAAACEIVGRGDRMQVRLIGHVARRYQTDLRRRILAVMSPAQTRTEDICRLNAEVGQAFARTAKAAARRLGLSRIDLIGSHGQTICHLPPRRGIRPPAQRQTVGTMQIGDAAIIACRLGVPVVSQFRQADMAVGGQGAPLVPWTDWVLFRHATRNRLIQNIGGIANLTWLPAAAGACDVRAFDTGPGNMLIDAMVSHFTRGRETFDKGGRRARRGTIRQDVLRHLMAHPYLAERPPKSCGREQFGEAFKRELLDRFRNKRIRGDDWIGTVTAFSAATMVAGFARLLRDRRGGPARIDEIVLCGGGAKNETLRRLLQSNLAGEARFTDAALTTTDAYGIPTQAKECVSFAMLAAACVDRVPANLPHVTGARRHVILGQICDTENT